jgi:hypothetical protein
MAHGFYVTISHRGVPHNHCRADSLRLHHLLAYQSPTDSALTLQGSATNEQPSSHKDETEHFYCAQLLHYGLKPLKTKGPAKKALLQAFGDGRTLVVPPHIVQLELQLKAEYEAALTRVKAEYQTREQEGEKKSQEHALTEVRERSKVEPAKDLKDRDTSSTRATVSSKIIRDSAAMQTASGKVCRVKLFLLPIAHSFYIFSYLQKLTYEDNSGAFDIAAPGISEEWPEMCRSGLMLKMSPSQKTGRHLWASFDFGVVSGIIRCANAPTTVGESCSFTWHGEEQYEGQLMFGNDNTGTLTFLGDGKLKGVIDGGCLGKKQFFGTYNKEASTNRVWPKYCTQWKARYRRINDSAYQIAAAGRWGKWVDDTSRPDPPEDSDSSGCAGGVSESDLEGSTGDEDQDSKSEKSPSPSAHKDVASPRRKQTARRGGWYPGNGFTRNEMKAKLPTSTPWDNVVTAPARPKQTARKSSGYPDQGRANYGKAIGVAFEKEDEKAVKVCCTHVALTRFH